MLKSQEAIYVTPGNCSVHPARRRASPVSLSTLTVLSMHKAELERAFPSQKPLFGFFQIFSRDF